MAKVVRWWRRILCWITGGHTFASSNLESYTIPEYDMTCFRNVCVKCGKANVYAVSNKALYYDGFPLYEQFGDWRAEDGNET